MINDAWMKAKPDLTVVSLPNFLLELDDVKSLTKWWDKRKSVSKNLAGGTLQYSFGVAPTIGDVTSIIDAVKNTQNKIREFEKTIGTVQKRTIKLDSNTVSKTGTFNYQGDSKQPCNWTATLNQRVTAHFSFAPKPILALNNADKAIRGFLDSLGFEANPRIIWEAVPFSFVVDWFFNVGKFLDSLKIDALELPVELIDGCLQLQETVSITSNLTLDKNSSVSSVNSWPTIATIKERFERLPFLPDYATLQAPDVRWPSLRQAELGFALVVANAGGGSSRASRTNSLSSSTLTATPFSNIGNEVLLR
jgi:hypothetical protein